MAKSVLPSISIVSPALAKANNGNWHTAKRWAHCLARSARARIELDWSGADDSMMIALHARRSAASIARFAEVYPQRPLVLVLTGTDLYRDIRTDPQAQRSLKLATRLVVLQSEGIRELEASLAAKATVIYQSARPLMPGRRSKRHFDLVLVGHQRPEKDPLTAMRALRLVPDDVPVRLFHVGAALDSELAAQVAKLGTGDGRYHWLGALSQSQTRQRIKRSHLLLLPSRMEGGANVLIEAVTSGVPVLGSDISGNRGMLGTDYPGWFPVGDAARLAELIVRAARDPRYYSTLSARCAQRAPLFSPAGECAAVCRLLDMTRQSTP
ncbi:selenoneine biosynthesis selenosugar synthase SenB [Sulfuritalea sp.]|uniref:selenoneine biosynthesis selenosugar synthase SenB n=1 Tax=Sulfuritalea sp. TaxID=2480090 RepID=UPI001AC076B3|nr:selenoneine biosynthesis selenosugar synthase SenB [Sulfuritalea sp.]MBN8474729.1 TIGR04348 family glycosyltransferase [Sulfuritalea sp.]